MVDTKSDTKIVQSEFKELHSVILNIMDSLSGIANPVASAAVQDLSNLANSLQNLRSKVSEQLRASQNKLKALALIGQAINSTQGLEAVLDEVLDAVIALTRAERSFVMLRNETGEFSVEAARGTDQISLNGDEFSISKTIIKKVAESGEPVLTTNAQEDPRFEMQNSIVEHNLRSIICVPLKIKEKITGVIFVDNRLHIGLFKNADLELLSAFADQAAVAIDNARLYDDLKEAYDKTLEGWALALELRDRETEGHTQRVKDLTLLLAEKFGIDAEEREHIKRGALLHDIGKMAIPDSVLLKPGKLTLAERKFMELHPEFARDMLENIDFLLPAMEIPYYHHEKWDGSGYPKNLKGEEIPLAARIFAVVDVWDALTSERPYRSPVAPEEVRRIIREKSGSHFDPKIVDAFLEIEDLPVPPRTGDTQLIQKLR